MIKKTLGLFTVLLGFVGVSFGATYELNQPSPIYNLGDDAIFTFTNGVNFNINSQYYNYMVAGGNNAKYNLFWSNTGLYFVYSYNWGSTDLNQGYIKKFCRTTYNNVCNGGTNATWINIDEFIGNSVYTNSDYFNVYESNTYSLAFCFGYEDLNESICFLISPYEKNEFSTFGGSLGIIRNPNLSDLPNDSIKNYFTVSPFSQSNTPNTPVIPDYEFNEDDTYTNGQIIQGYNAMGLTDEFCYGGFALDNIFEAGTVPQMFTGYMWGGGAFIFDVWNIYSGAYNNDYISFLRSFYVSYVNNNYSDFYGKTKALYGFINQWFSVSSKGLGFIESTAPTFTLVDVWQYCDLRFNKDTNSIYTGDRWDPKYRYYTSGQVNLGGYFNFSGNNNYFSGNLSGFNTPKDFFASLNSIFQGGLNNLENHEPVLPTYIIIFFLAIIFIRIISH